jgi:hypothetical protein
MAAGALSLMEPTLFAVLWDPQPTTPAPPSSPGAGPLANPCERLEWLDGRGRRTGGGNRLGELPKLGSRVRFPFAAQKEARFREVAEPGLFLWCIKRRALS